MVIATNVSLSSWYTFSKKEIFFYRRTISLCTNNKNPGDFRCTYVLEKQNFGTLHSFIGNDANGTILYLGPVRAIFESDV